jgi:3',5'-cyclic-AMP phosphodiesterase
LCLGGDISHSERLIADLNMLAAAFKKPIYFVLGNHDYYYSSWESVSAQALGWCQAYPNAHWLSYNPFTSLTDKVALIGHDGWADGRHGDFQSIWKQVSDYYLIENLSNCYWEDCLDKMRNFADGAASHLARTLRAALEVHELAIVLTHVPPFQEATWHEGRLSDEDWLPHFASRVAGDVLKQVMISMPGRDALVLCGHTHGTGEARILPNLVCLTGGAEYGNPHLQRVFNLDDPSLGDLF